MKRLFSLFVDSIFCITAGVILGTVPAYAQTQEQEIARCIGISNTIIIVEENSETIIRAIYHKDQITWLNTAAQIEPTTTGINYSNIRGEQKVNLFIPNSQESCEITIGNQPKELGNLITKKMTQGTIRGTVTYLQRIALPAGAVVQVKLLDVSRQDVAATEIASQTITTNGEQVPIPFELIYDPQQIDQRYTYVVRAEIYIDNQLTFTTTRMYPVLTQGNGEEVELVVEQVLSPKSQLTGSKWLLEDLAGKGVIDNLQTTLEFGENNGLFGTGGCNRYFSSYQLKGSDFQVGMIGSTQMMCPEAVMNQEQEFFAALGKAYQLRLEGPYLLIDIQGSDLPLKFTRL